MRCQKGLFHHMGSWGPVHVNNVQIFITGPYGKCLQWMRICSKCGFTEFRYIQVQEPVEQSTLKEK